MTVDAHTRAPFGPLKWAALAVAVVGILFVLVWSDRGWLGPPVGYALVIGLVCSVPMGRVIGKHPRTAQLSGGLLIIALAVCVMVSSQSWEWGQAVFIALMGVLILVQGIFPRLRTWRTVKDPNGTRPPFTAR